MTDTYRDRIANQRKQLYEVIKEDYENCGSARQMFIWDRYNQELRKKNLLSYGDGLHTYYRKRIARKIRHKAKSILKKVDFDNVDDAVCRLYHEWNGNTKIKNSYGY